MNDKQLIEEIESVAKKHFSNLGPSHDWAHVQRVLKNVNLLAKKENANFTIVNIAAYLHDIERKDLKEANYDHAIEGAKLARRILKKYPLTPKQIDNICHCIEVHRYRNSKIPDTIEAKCLQDADKLDVLGAIGIARSYIYLGETRDFVIYLKPEKVKTGSKRRTNSVQEEFEVKYKYLPDKMWTKTGKSIARKRLKYMKDFLDRLEDEVLGNS